MAEFSHPPLFVAPARRGGGALECRVGI